MLTDLEESELNIKNNYGMLSDLEKSELNIKNNYY